MARMAFEIVVNGEHLYTVGDKHWKAISAQLAGHHFDPDEFRATLGEESSDLPTEPFDHLQLSCFVAVYGEDTQVVGPDGKRYPKSKSGSYPVKTLVPGDTLQIRVVETETTDSPGWHSDDPQSGGSAGVFSNS